MIHLVWEHLIAVPGPKYTERRFRRRLNWRRYDSALDLWATNPGAVQAIWTLWDEGSEGVAVITYLPPVLWRPVLDRLTADSLPHLRFIPSTPDEMAHIVALRPDISQIIDGNPAHALRYGPKGFHLPANSAHLIGKAV